jgi:hypothetical protein
VEEKAALAGVAWAVGVRAGLVADGREAEGGWPGTMTEARARAEELCAQGLAPPERQRLGRILYAAARAEWRLR